MLRPVFRPEVGEVYRTRCGTLVRVTFVNGHEAGATSVENPLVFWTVTAATLRRVQPDSSENPSGG